jgi:hypothetical protein
MLSYPSPAKRGEGGRPQAGRVGVPNTPGGFVETHRGITT